MQQGGFSRIGAAAGRLVSTRRSTRGERRGGPGSHQGRSRGGARAPSHDDRGHGSELDIQDRRAGAGSDGRSGAEAHREERRSGHRGSAHGDEIPGRRAGSRPRPGRRGALRRDVRPLRPQGEQRHHHSAAEPAAGCRIRGLRQSARREARVGRAGQGDGSARADPEGRSRRPPACRPGMQPRAHSRSSSSRARSRERSTKRTRERWRRPSPGSSFRSCEAIHVDRRGVSSQFSNHALANSQSRFTVAMEMPRTSAVSVSIRPPKNRSSTTRLARGSAAASCVSA